MLKRKSFEKAQFADNLPNIKNLFLQQQEAVSKFFDLINYDEITALARKLYDCKGSVLFTGVGKSGFVAKKINQTLVSTGTRALWLAPVDALHGDIGLVSQGDILVMFSKSGSTKELLTLVPYAKAKGAYIVALTSKPESTLARVSDMHVTLPLQNEVKAFAQVETTESRESPPATSNSIQMLFGDTIAVALMIARGLSMKAYAMNHPAGRIGKRLVMKVKDIMKEGKQVCKCTPGENGLAALSTMAANPNSGGVCMVVDANDCLLGTLADGDLRRALAAKGKSILDLPVKELMNFAKQFPHTVPSSMMAIDAMGDMDTKKVNYLPVVGENNKLEGVLTLHDLVAAGL
mmetsp:Transcript_4137/g.8487  ORF Transcript_4137/g.8487 Transcript_4137/m.8487 type:complete len:348 (-) Transcript_4137:650-1693(-)|eukprot:CAMPEP_0118940650 /NCGR_PEP_ID=MMETSP1169-20130426/31966_1 /TAXON_ID=36882 /ORGANISM="Pyramimonas obovata, Strain CCMP722" /LENGTH=347 /DNA_ID=CAMNT_0006885201 /DNA_START=57 /DNA_END=1100 /DNA_ORIENTATION=+